MYIRKRPSSFCWNMAPICFIRVLCTEGDFHKINSCTNSTLRLFFFCLFVCWSLIRLLCFLCVNLFYKPCELITIAAAAFIDLASICANAFDMCWLWETLTGNIKLNENCRCTRRHMNELKIEVTGSKDYVTWFNANDYYYTYFIFCQKAKYIKETFRR